MRTIIGPSRTLHFGLLAFVLFLPCHLFADPATLALAKQTLDKSASRLEALLRQLKTTPTSGTARSRLLSKLESEGRSTARTIDSLQRSLTKDEQEELRQYQRLVLTGAIQPNLTAPPLPPAPPPPENTSTTTPLSQSSPANAGPPVLNSGSLAHALAQISQALPPVSPVSRGAANLIGAPLMPGSGGFTNAIEVSDFRVFDCDCGGFWGPHHAQAICDVTTQHGVCRPGPSGLGWCIEDAGCEAGPPANTVPPEINSCSIPVRQHVFCDNAGIHDITVAGCSPACVAPATPFCNEFKCEGNTFTYSLCGCLP